jgi:hypothetical protein
MLTDYNIENYKTIIQKILDNGYQFVFYPSDAVSKISDNNEVLLRHDIDFSLLAAKHIAEIDNSLGIKSTFFVYLNSPFYNILFEKDKECIDFIISLGHEVALHYDWRVDIEIEYEIELLSKLFPDIRTNFISIHKPPKKDELNRIIEKLNLKNINTTYDSDYFENLKYISDSKCNLDIDELFSIVELTHIAASPPCFC